MRSRNRQRRQNKPDTRDRWMITYADLITLLLIFFVIMFAMSRLDIEKYETITQSLQLTFKSGDSLLEKGNGILGTADPYTQVNPPATSGKDDEGDKSSDVKADTPAPMTERELAFREQEEELLNLMNMIQQYIKDNKLEDQIHVSDLPKGISITLSDRFLFDVGRADLKEDSAKTLAKLASLFRTLDTIVSIEGHTDSVPVGEASKFKDNWELSGARALSVLRYFIDQEDLDPAGFQYAGYADTRPTGDNDTADGRQKNRRVEITVLRQLQQ
ncbi:flagellar motor protein [Paenibacillus anaericanus]|uniref:Flagellar motor protein n=1 Tax=Paenibacillus anaericanus TaxID=170367 RepID=A0A433Y414_9BACL|nr:flagellar motor protein MotB [Paenibacillus anaericanus]RUT42858.1 flagellar motor protein [Paenibacillus anaericanus]